VNCSIQCYSVSYMHTAAQLEQLEFCWNLACFLMHNTVKELLDTSILKLTWTICKAYVCVSSGILRTQFLKTNCSNTKLTHQVKGNSVRKSCTRNSTRCSAPVLLQQRQVLPQQTVILFLLQHSCNRKSKTFIPKLSICLVC
jgi:hypothetical protein